MKERFDTLGIPNIITRNTDRTLTDSERINIIESAYGRHMTMMEAQNERPV